MSNQNIQCCDIVKWISRTQNELPFIDFGVHLYIDHNVSAYDYQIDNFPFHKYFENNEECKKNQINYDQHYGCLYELSYHSIEAYRCIFETNNRSPISKIICNDEQIWVDLYKFLKEKVIRLMPEIVSGKLYIEQLKKERAIRHNIYNELGFNDRKTPGGAMPDDEE